MTDRSGSHAAHRLAEETGTPRERFTADDKPLPELDELEPVTDAGVDQDDGVVHNSSSDLPTIEFVTESGARRRVEYERVGEARRVVRRELRHSGSEWVTIGSERVRSLEIDGEARMPVNLRLTGDN